MSPNRQGWLLDGLSKGKESKADQKPLGEEQSKEIKAIGLAWGEHEMIALDKIG